MRISAIFFTLLATSLFALPVGLDAQASDASPAPEASGQQQEIPLPSGLQAMLELQDLRRHLNEVRTQAFEDSTLATEARQIEDLLMARMKQIDPEAETYLDRLATLQERYQSAQKMQDSTYMEEVAQEGRPLSQEVDSLRQKVIDQEDVAERVTSFQKELRDEMLSIEPDLDSLESRAMELQDEAREFMADQDTAGS